MYYRQSLQQVAHGGGMAEEVLSTIRTAQAFGTQSTLAGLYNAHVENARILDAKAAVWNGCGMAVFYFFIYSAYALAFSFGTTLINEGHGELRPTRPIFVSASELICFYSFRWCCCKCCSSNFDRVAVARFACPRNARSAIS
jgi:ATP-binding cassette subfamily B (MDR/TAP) protein 1